MARKPVNNSVSERGGVMSIFSCTIPHMRALLAALLALGLAVAAAAPACEPAIQGVPVETARYALAYQLPHVKGCPHFPVQVAARGNDGARPGSLNVGPARARQRHGMHC